MFDIFLKQPKMIDEQVNIIFLHRLPIYLKAGITRR